MNIIEHFQQRVSITATVIKTPFQIGSKSVADPGFPVGGRAPVSGGVDLRRGHFSVKMYAKTKELGPIGGHVPGTPPRSANASVRAIIERGKVLSPFI